jgi:hypothetical protein
MSISKENKRARRDDYKRKLAEAEDGILTPSGYLVPMKKRRKTPVDGYEQPKKGM